MFKYILCVAVFLQMSFVAKNSADDKIGYSEIVDVAGASAPTLNTRAGNFMKLKKIEPKTAGNVISGVGILTVSYPSIKFGTDNGHIRFNFKIAVKDGKYKVDMTDFKHEGIHGKSSGGSVDLEKPECGDQQIYPAAWTKIKEQTQEQLKAYVKELKSKMANPVKAAPSNTDF